MNSFHAGRPSGFRQRVLFCRMQENTARCTVMKLELNFFPTLGGLKLPGPFSGELLKLSSRLTGIDFIQAY